MHKIVCLRMILLLGLSQGVYAQEPVYEADLQRLLQEGKDASSLFDYSIALEKWQAGLSQAQALDNRQYISQFLFQIGLVYTDLGQYERALEYYEQALVVRREIGDRRGEGQTLNNIGLVYDNLGQYKRASQYYEQALLIRREIGDRRGEGQTQINIGLVYDNLGQYEQALEAYEQALAIARELGNQRSQGIVLGNIGVVFDNLGQYPQALEAYDLALTIARKIGDQRSEGHTLANVGLVYDDLGQYAQALEYYEQALAITRAIDYRRGEGFTLSYIGLVYANLGQYAQALETYKQALAIIREVGFRRGEGYILTNIGVVYDNLGQYAQALEYYEQALAMTREIGDRRYEGQSLTNIGLAYWNLGQYAQALEYHKQALAIAQEISDRLGEGQTLTNIGLVYDELGQYQDAAAAFHNSISIHEALGTFDSLWRAQGGLATVEAKLEQFESAVRHYEQALDTIEALRAGLTKKEHKLSFMQDKLYVYDALIDLLQNLHHIYPDKGYDRKALEIFERKQGRVFLEEMGQSGARHFAGLPESIMQRELDLENQREQIRQQLADERAKPIKEQHQALIQALEEREADLQVEQAALQAQIKTDYPDYYALRYPTPVSLDELQQQVLQPGELLLVYGVMQKNISLWVIGQEEFQLYSLSIGEDALAEKVAALRTALANEWDISRGLLMSGQTPHTKQTPFTQLSYELYTLLLPEAVRSLVTSPSTPLLQDKENRTLTIVPTGPLYILPFEILITSPPAPLLKDEGSTLPILEEGRDERRPHYLIEEFPISYLSSASLLKTLREAQARRTTSAHYPLLAFAHPVYDSTPDPSQTDSNLLEKTTPDSSHEERRGSSLQTLRRQSYRALAGGEFVELPETADEARAIADLLKAPENSKPLQLRDNASRANIFTFNQHGRLKEYQYLVFAMHGVLPGDVDQITQSALVLSDDFLTMADVFGLQLHAKLVSLSACNTGIGEQVKGEGVMGLTRAFMYAGTPVVAVTLWSVESLSAKDLNIGFFRHLHAGLPPTQALQAIKIEMLGGDLGEKYRHPYYWAPFVVFGDGR
jgi:tetratricopeptide (TPR) repeat protein/CHAT domain-containing protein